MTDLSILLPARNEEPGLAATLAEIPYRELRLRGYSVEVVVVDGASEDRTREVALEWGARVLSQAAGGKGDAVRGALPRLASDFVVMMDADRTYPAWEIPRFVARLEMGADLVLGSRMRGRRFPGAMTPLHVFGNRGLSMLASVVHARRVTDVCSGMWAFRRSAVAALGLASRRFEVEAEMFSRAVRAGLRIEEIPIEYRPRLGRTKLSGLLDGAAIARTLLETRLLRAASSRDLRARGRTRPTGR